MSRANRDARPAAPGPRLRLVATSAAGLTKSRPEPRRRPSRDKPRWFYRVYLIYEDDRIERIPYQRWSELHGGFDALDEHAGEVIRYAKFMIREIGDEWKIVETDYGVMHLDTQGRHGDEHLIKDIFCFYDPDLETMERLFNELLAASASRRSRVVRRLMLTTTPSRLRQTRRA